MLGMHELQPTRDHEPGSKRMKRKPTLSMYGRQWTAVPRSHRRVCQQRDPSHTAADLHAQQALRRLSQPSVSHKHLRTTVEPREVKVAGFRNRPAPVVDTAPVAPSARAAVGAEPPAVIPDLIPRLQFELGTVDSLPNNPEKSGRSVGEATIREPSDRFALTECSCRTAMVQEVGMALTAVERATQERNSGDLKDAPDRHPSSIITGNTLLAHGRRENDFKTKGVSLNLPDFEAAAFGDSDALAFSSVRGSVVATVAVLPTLLPRVDIPLSTSQYELSPSNQQPQPAAQKANDALATSKALHLALERMGTTKSELTMQISVTTEVRKALDLCRSLGEHDKRNKPMYVRTAFSQLSSESQDFPLITVCSTMMLSKKRHTCSFCGKCFKNENEARRHESTLHVRSHFWSCSALLGYDGMFQNAMEHPGQCDACCFCGDELTARAHGADTMGPTCIRLQL